MSRLISIEDDIKRLKRKLCCNKIVYDIAAAFPVVGSSNVLYVDKLTGDIYIWNGTTYVTAAGAVQLNGYLSMTAAIAALGLGKQFYYLAMNLDGASKGSIHITTN